MPGQIQLAMRTPLPTRAVPYTSADAMEIPEISLTNPSYPPPEHTTSRKTVEDLEQRPVRPLKRNRDSQTIHPGWVCASILSTALLVSIIPLAFLFIFAAVANYETFAVRACEPQDGQCQLVIFASVWEQMAELLLLSPDCKELAQSRTQTLYQQDYSVVFDTVNTGLPQNVTVRFEPPWKAWPSGDSVPTYLDYGGQIYNHTTPGNEGPSAWYLSPDDEWFEFVPFNCSSSAATTNLTSSSS